MDDHFAIRQALSNCSSLRRSWAATGDPGGPPVATNPRPDSVTPMLIVEFDFRPAIVIPARCAVITRLIRRLWAVRRFRVAGYRCPGAALQFARPVEFCIPLTEFFGQRRSMSSVDHAPRSGCRGLREANMRLARLPTTAGPLRLRPPRRCQSWARALPKSRCHGHWLLG
jgi:hypothetical protein